MNFMPEAGNLQMSESTDGILHGSVEILAQCIHEILVVFAFANLAVHILETKRTGPLRITTACDCPLAGLAIRPLVLIPSRSESDPSRGK